MRNNLKYFERIWLKTKIEKDYKMFNNNVMKYQRFAKDLVFLQLIAFNSKLTIYLRVFGINNKTDVYY